MNLDLKCAVAAESVTGEGESEKMEKLCQNATSILAQHGPYAFFLYLQCEKNGGRAGLRLASHCHKLLLDVFDLRPEGGDSKSAALATVKTLAGDVGNLLLARRLLTQVLTYTRYQVRSRADGVHAGGD